MCFPGCPKSEEASNSEGHLKQTDESLKRERYVPAPGLAMSRELNMTISATRPVSDRKSRKCFFHGRRAKLLTQIVHGKLPKNLR